MKLFTAMFAKISQLEGVIQILKKHFDQGQLRDVFAEQDGRENENVLHKLLLKPITN